MIRPMWHVRGAVLDPNDGTLIMGVVNVTPDSFSGDGRFLQPDEAILQGLRQRDDGAHLVDVGGESTRPGAPPVSAQEELRRILPVIEGLTAQGVLASVDTSKPAVAEAAVDAGAVVVNDVAGLRVDGMADVCADAGVGVVIMHMLGDPRIMQEDPRYDDVVSDIRRHLEGRTEAAVAAGVNSQAVAIDPGIGFGKTLNHNLSLLNGVPSFAATGFPVLVGVSRKSFLGTLTGRKVGDRDIVTAVSVGLSIMQGVSIVRVHNVPFAADAAALADAMVRARDEDVSPKESNA